MSFPGTIAPTPRERPTLNTVPTRVHLALALVLCGTPFAAGPAVADEGDPIVRIERISQRDATADFGFSKVPAPSSTDAGNIATITLVRGTADPNGASPFVLQDGQLPRNEDQPDANFFLAGNTPGRLLFDFGKSIALRGIKSYSWHRSTRADQRYDIHLPSADVDAADIVTSAAAETLPESWRRIASVDTRDAGAASTQVGVSITGPDGGPIATTRYVLLLIAPTDRRIRFGQTFYSEIDFLDGVEHPPARSPEPVRVVDDLVIEDERLDDEVTIPFDTTETPDLRTGRSEGGDWWLAIGIVAPVPTTVRFVDAGHTAWFGDDRGTS